MPRLPDSSLASHSAGRNLLALLIFLHAFVGLLAALAPRLDATIPNSMVSLEQGAAYIVPLRYGGGFLYTLRADTLSATTASRLKLFEDGKELGPAHAPHASIREQGGGRFSHWGNTLRFSTSDGSDPRTNGRVYLIASPTALNFSWIFGLLVLDVGLLIAVRRQALALLASGRGRMLLVCSGAIVLAAVGLTSAGLFGTITLTPHGAPKDSPLVLGVVAHAALGSVTTLAFWVAGAGLVRLLVRDPHASLASILLPAFPLALAALAVLVSVALVAPYGRTVASVLWFVCLLPLAGWRPPGPDVRRLLTALLAIVPCGSLFGIWMALLWHGPTATLAGSPSGDMSFYASHIWSLAARPHPFIDLTYANGPPLSYFNMLFSAFGAALVFLPGFDPFLFLLTGGGTWYVVFSALMLHLYIAQRVDGALPTLATVMLPLAFVVAARYPSWVVESPPMIFVPGLTIAVWWMVEQSRKDLRWGGVAFAAGVLGSALTKVVTAITIVPLAATTFWRRFETMGRSARIGLLTLVCAFGIYSLLLLSEHLPTYLKAAKPGPEGFARPQWWFWWRDASALPLAVLALRIAERPVALAIIGGLASFLAFPFLLYANFICAVLLLGLIASTSPETSDFVRLSTIGAFGCALPAALLSDPSGPSTGAVWLVCFGGAMFIGVVVAARVEGLADRFRLSHVALVAVTTVVLGGLGLFGVARGHIIVTSGWHPGVPELTPEVRDIWSAVSRLTSPNALIFTDQIGDTPHNETPSLLRGWNVYATRGQRQVFLSSYYTVPELRYDPANRRQVLATNELVLSGALAPANVATTRNHDSFFAVVARSRTVPGAWQKIYENGVYGLYSISSSPALRDR